MRQLMFAKAVQCRRGVFPVGAILPAYLSTPETIRQFREQFGEDVLIESRDAAESMTEVMASLRRIEKALGIDAPSNGGTDTLARLKAKKSAKSS